VRRLQRKDSALRLRLRSNWEEKQFKFQVMRAFFKILHDKFRAEPMDRVYDPRFIDRMKQRSQSSEIKE
jgi:hypothetical protein